MKQEGMALGTKVAIGAAVVALGGGALFMSFGAPATTTCPAGQTKCGTVCVNTSTDTSNCGACGKTCTGGRCENGACHCPTGKTNCNGVCKGASDYASDNANCGTCGNACKEGRACVNGSCACPTGKTECNGQCVDTSTDTNNCGSCGRTCPATWTCGGGVCCPADSTRCFGICKNLQTDPLNCGSCNNQCGANATCSAGACVCAAGYARSPLSGKCERTCTNDVSCDTQYTTTSTESGAKLFYACAKGPNQATGVCVPQCVPGANNATRKSNSLDCAQGEICSASALWGSNGEMLASSNGQTREWHTFCVPKLSAHCTDCTDHAPCQGGGQTPFYAGTSSSTYWCLTPNYANGTPKCGIAHRAGPYNPHQCTEAYYQR